MSKKLRLIKTTIYVRHDQFNELEGTDFNELQEPLRSFVSKKGNSKDCVSIVRVLPTLASENTVDIEIGHMVVKQATDPLIIMGDLG